MRGETIRQVSPRGTCTDSRYDGRGRVWQRTDYANASCSGASEAQANWLFDTASNGIGSLAEENSSVGGVQRVAITPTYDSYGRGKTVTTLLDGKTYVGQSTYDQYGRPYQSFFTAPGVNSTGELIEYNSQGYQYRVRSAYPSTSGLIDSEVITNARGQVTDERRMAGAQIMTTREYDTNTGRLKRIQTAGGYLQDLSYDYDNLGNVTYREDATGFSAILREEFDYDALQRLLSATVKRNGTIQPGQQSYTYAGDGNISTKSGVSGSYVYASRPSQCTTVSGSVTPGPHAVSQANNTSYCYDANGNLLRTFIGASSTSDKILSWTAYDQTATISSAQANSKVGFDYGPNRERIRRLDYAAALSTSAETVTHFVGGAEVRWTVNSSTNGANVLQEVRRYLGGIIIVQRGTGTAQTIRREYLLTDAQGSTYAVLDDYGMPINASARMSFDPFGRRRAADDWLTATPWSVALGSELKDTTRRGYTGHEQVDAVGIIHMGGRIYDPILGRFLQADPFVQAPGNSQSLNRYSYVFNNPMAYTDPTGYWGAKEQAGLRTVAAIVIACVTGYYAGAAISAGGAGAVGNAAAISFAGGFAAGAVQSGTLRGAAIGGISSLAFFGVAQAFPVKGMNIASGEGMAAYSKLALASGITGGVMAELQGGRFGNGFVTAGANAYLAPIPEAASSNAGTQTVIAAVIGGTVSRVTGGKFANGAVTGAFQFAVGRAVASSSGQKKRGAFDYTDAELQGFVDASPKFGMDLSLNDDFLNSSKGIGDSLSFGSTRAIREWIDGAPDSAVDTDSYKIGYYGVMVPSLVRLGSRRPLKQPQKSDTQ